MVAYRPMLLSVPDDVLRAVLAYCTGEDVQALRTALRPTRNFPLLRTLYAHPPHFTIPKTLYAHEIGVVYNPLQSVLLFYGKRGMGDRKYAN